MGRPGRNLYYYVGRVQARIYVGTGGQPVNQKLADRSDVIFEVSKCSKMQISTGLRPGPPKKAYSAPPDTLADGEGARCSPPKNPTPALGPSVLVSTGIRG